MAENTAPAGYVLPQDNGAAYRGAYAQAHVDRLRADWEQANQELFSRYGMDLARQKYLQDQIDEERKYMLKLDELMLAEPKKDPSTAPGGGSGRTELIAEIEALKDLKVEQAKRASENQDRVAKLMEIQDKSWTAPSSSVTALSNLAAGLGGQPGLYATPEALASAIQTSIADDRYAGAVAALGTEEQRRDAAIKLVGAVSARTGLPASQSRTAVASALGLNPDDLDPVAFAVEKEAARDDFQKKAYATTDFGGSLASMLEADIKKRMGGNAATGLSPDRLAADRKLADDYLHSDEWRTVSAALRDTGRLTADWRDPDSMVMRPDGTGDIITPEMVQRYDAARRAIQEADIQVAESDARLFDDLFLSRVAAKHDSQKRMEGYQAALTKVNPSVPTVEEVRRRTSEIYEPESGRGEKRVTPAQLSSRTGVNEATGEEATRKELGLPSRLTDQQQATLAATRAAFTLARGGTAWQEDGTAAQKAASQVRGLLEAGLKPDEVYGKVAELSAGDTALRDDIYSRVLAYEVLSADAKKFTPADAKNTPRADTQPPPSAADMKKARNQAALDALQAIDYNVDGL